MRRLKPAATGLPLAAVLAWLLIPATAQERAPSTVRVGSMPSVSQAGKIDWPLHNFDLFNGRYSPANEINPSNAGSLALTWSFEVGAGESIGNQGVLRLVNNALNIKFPGKYPPDLDPATIGYAMRTPPAYFNNTLYVGLSFGDSHIPGGLLAAVDAKTGAIKWVFNTVPQGAQD